MVNQPENEGMIWQMLSSVEICLNTTTNTHIAHLGQKTWGHN